MLARPVVQEGRPLKDKVYEARIRRQLEDGNEARQLPNQDGCGKAKDKSCGGLLTKKSGDRRSTYKV